MERIGNFICEAVPAPGVGNFVLGTPVPGRLPWSAGVAAGYFVYPMLVMYIANDTTKQEWGYGTLTATGLSRDTVLWTSAGSTAKINFATSPVYVYSEIPAERTVYRDPTTGRLIATYDISSPTQNMGPLAGHRNRLINSGFQINQRAYAGAAALAGVYTHDRWKAGVSGCTYSTAAGSPASTITITAGTLQQVIDAAQIEGGTYVLSWTGSALARVDNNAYGPSPLVTNGLAGGVSHTVELNTGTVSQPQFETGDTKSNYEIRHGEQHLCDRYYVSGNFDWSGYGAAGAVATMNIHLPVKMRVAPTLVVTPTTQTNCSTPTLTPMTNRDLRLGTTVTALGAFVFAGTYTAASEL
jgi:hypothetical protein